MSPSPLSPTGERLLEHIQYAEQIAQQPQGDTIHVTGVAGGVYFAYEQLRNAASYTQQHLLLRAAIERYLHRALYLPDKKAPKIAEELIIELTQARYIKNDSVAQPAIDDINRVTAQYIRFFAVLTTEHKVPRATASRWIYQVLSVTMERLLVPRPLVDGFVDTAYYHYLETVDRAQFGKIEPHVFNAALYFALHHVLMKSDLATTRYYWLLMQSTGAMRPEPFIEACKTVDEWFEHTLTNKIARVLHYYGAPMRSLRELVIRNHASEDILLDKNRLLAKLENVVVTQYDSILSTALSTLWRMVAFVALTKMLVGIAIEIPYDLLVHGAILTLPLILNLIFPPLYMASAMFRIRRPGPGNTDTILSYTDQILYKTGHQLSYKLTERYINSQLRVWFNVIYAVTFLVPFALLIWGLVALGFDLMHGVIFFSFLSGVSFLRFRLLKSARELDILNKPQSLTNAIGNFFHMPFVHLGRWLSDRYRQVNVISFILDMAIELPLKTSLKILRQWVGFVSDKHERL